MKLSTIEWVKTVLIISGIGTVIFLTITIMIRRWMKELLLRKMFTFFMCIILTPFLLGLAWSGFNVARFHHDFLHCFGKKWPTTFGELTDMRQYIVSKIIQSKDHADERILFYQKQKSLLNSLPRKTPEDIRIYILEQETLADKLDFAISATDMYHRYRACAYYAGFAKEVRAIPDIVFSETIAEVWNRKFTH